MQAAYYPAAVCGNLSAANLVLKVIARRCAIMGFDKVEYFAESQHVIVIGGTDEEYCAGCDARRRLGGCSEASLESAWHRLAASGPAELGAWRWRVHGGVRDGDSAAKRRRPGRGSR